MRQLQKTVRSEGSAVPSLPNMWPSLRAKGVNIRRGEIAMIAGKPGEGKSTLALALAVRSGVPALYLSADTPSHTMSLRLIAMLLGTDTDSAERAMLEDPEWASQVLERARHIRWSFESQPSLDDIEDQIRAHLELTTYAPELLIVDNLIDLTGGKDEFSESLDILKDFKYLAREYDIAIVVLHHAAEGAIGNPCPPRDSLRGKTSQTPALILTIVAQPGFMGVCAVKNRYGKSAPMGDDAAWLTYDPSQMLISDIDESELQAKWQTQITV